MLGPDRDPDLDPDRNPEPDTPTSTTPHPLPLRTPPAAPPSSPTAAAPRRRPRRWRALAILAAACAVAYLGFGVWARSRRAARPAPPPGEIHGAYHVHTRKSDGRGTLEEVVRAAKQAGLQFVAVTDHNVMSLEDAGYHDGILVIEGSEVSAPYGHIVALGISRELTREERQRDTLGTIGALGGRAMLAHPFHPKRPFTKWARSDWTGFEVLSNDSFWGQTVAERGFGRMALAALLLPWDGAQSVLAFYHAPERELRRFDALPLRERHPLLCASDAHGWPTYRAAFEAFSMHVPVSLTGDARVDTAAVVAALLSPRAYCVVDGVAPAWGVSLAKLPAGDGLRLSVKAPGGGRRASYRLLKDGVPLGALEPGAAGVATFLCGGRCSQGAYRVEGRWDGRPWIFTNPVVME